MLAYFSSMFLLMFLSFCEHYRLLVSKNIAIFYAIIVVVLFTGLRGDVGQDTSNYLIMYENIYAFKDKLEVGFYTLMRIFQYLNFDFNFFLFFIALCSVSFYFFAISKLVHKGYVIFAFLLIFCDLYIYFNFSGIRQGLALSLCMVSSYFAFQQKWKTFVLFVLFAFLMHKSAIVFLISYPILKYRVNFKLSTIIKLITVAILSVALTRFVIYSSDYFTFIKGAALYLSEDYNKLSWSAYFVGLIRRLYPVLFFLFFFKVLKNDKVLMAFFSLYMFGFAIFALNYPILQDTSVRLSSYFTIFESILMARMLYNLNFRFNRFVIYCVVGMVMFFKIYTYSILDEYDYHLVSGLF
ncbi:EpsG family protein [Vibrio parahaemolyticus]|uniref:EpsG family protein n=2 Tax=Vibrio parahaemolyticus TaxID=670 RepID=UPI000A35FFB3|nr:EpsG family protein [Vibrio parahaemolyticus]OUJ36394.1 hypothetical protein BTR40_10835 [Vibrio parahaemolyticus]